MSSSRKSSPSGNSQVPRIHVAPRGATSDGSVAAAFAAAYGLEPDEWQLLILDDWLSMLGSRWSSLTCGLAVSRQNGKNALLEIRELYGMVALGEKILHTAHEVKTAQKHFRRLKYFFGQKAEDEAALFPELNALVSQVRSVNGQEAIFLKGGGSIELVARSKNSGRGFTVDVLVMDEAQELSEDSLEALMPTTSASPLGNPQWLFTGTPPGPNAAGEVFTRVRNEALGSSPGRLCWHEWSVEGVVDLDDRETWRMTNPALDSGRLQVEVIEGERARFSDEGFARERLGVWPAVDGSTRAISEAQWAKTAVDAPPEAGAKSFGIAFSFDGHRVSLAGALAHGSDQAHVELIDAAFSNQGGLAPLADWLCEKDEAGAARWRRAGGDIVIGGSAGAGVLRQLLIDRRVPSKRIRVVNTPQYLQACAMFYDSTKDGSMSHLSSDGQRVLDESVAVVDRDKRGGWMATVPDADETPVEAVSLALWGARSNKRRARADGERKGAIL